VTSPSSEELTPADVESYTDGRLAADNPKTQLLLDIALDKARKFCGWHVSPVITSTVTLHGSGESWITLPTLQIDEIVSVVAVEWVNGVETNVTKDLSGFEILSEEPSVIYRKRDSAGCHVPHWHEHTTYIITFSHGFAAADAGAFRGAVLEYIDAASMSIGTGGVGPLSQFQVDDVIMKWASAGNRSEGDIANNPLVASALYQYRLLAFA
jgi:hypothetical protein